jgi:hypothetical protein
MDKRIHVINTLKFDFKWTIKEQRGQSVSDRPHVRGLRFDNGTVGTVSQQQFDFVNKNVKGPISLFSSSRIVGELT